MDTTSYNSNAMSNLLTEKKSYNAPHLTVVVFKVEQGYASSRELSIFFDRPEFGDRDIEDRTDNNDNWGGGSGIWF